MTVAAGRSAAEMIHRRPDCRGCGSVNLDAVLRLRPTPIGDAFISRDRASEEQPEFPIELFMCRDCGLAQLLDVVDPEILYGDGSLPANSAGFAAHFEAYADSVITRCRLSPGSFVVDLGSSDGILLRAFQQRGMAVLGVDPVESVATQATAAGLPTIVEFFTSAVAARIVAERGRAQVVTANNVFANVDDLAAWVEAVKGMFAVDGVFVLESFYLGDLVKNMVFDFIYHEHLTAFSVKPMRTLFDRAGLELVAVERIPAKGGSIRYFVQRSGGPVSRDGSVDELILSEERAGLYDANTFADFTDRIEALSHRTRSFLAQARAAGKTIAGFGASVTGTTLIYHFGIGGLLDYLVDDNPAKQDKLSPGIHLPVLPTSALESMQPDIVVVLAWRFAEPVMRQHASYLARGGQFVIPAPEFRVVRND